MIFFFHFEHVGRLVVTKITPIHVLHFQHLNLNSIYLGNFLRLLPNLMFFLAQEPIAYNLLQGTERFTNFRNFNINKLD